jgi:hypothetical protein
MTRSGTRTWIILLAILEHISHLNARLVDLADVEHHEARHCPPCSEFTPSLATSLYS